MLDATLSTTVLIVAPTVRIIFWAFFFIALRRPFLEVLIKYAAVPAATDAAAIPAAAVAAILLFFIGCIIHHPIYRKIPYDALHRTVLLFCPQQPRLNCIVFGKVHGNHIFHFYLLHIQLAIFSICFV